MGKRGNRGNRSVFLHRLEKREKRENGLLVEVDQNRGERDGNTNGTIGIRIRIRIRIRFGMLKELRETRRIRWNIHENGFLRFVFRSQKRRKRGNRRRNRGMALEHRAEPRERHNFLLPRGESNGPNLQNSGIRFGTDFLDSESNHWFELCSVNETQFQKWNCDSERSDGDGIRLESLQFEEKKPRSLGFRAEKQKPRIHDGGM